MRLTIRAPNLMQRLSELPTVPNVTLLDRRKTKPHLWPHDSTTFTKQIYIRWCCIDLSNAPDLSGMAKVLAARGSVNSVLLPSQSRKSNLLLIRFDEGDDEAGEFVGLFEIHQVAGVFNDDATRVADSNFYDAGMGVHVWNVDVADEDQSWHVYFAQAGQSVG